MWKDYFIFYKSLVYINLANVNINHILASDKNLDIFWHIQQQILFFATAVALKRHDSWLKNTQIIFYKSLGSLYKSSQCKYI